MRLFCEQMNTCLRTLPIHFSPEHVFYADNRGPPFFNVSRPLWKSRRNASQRFPRRQQIQKNVCPIHEHKLHVRNVCPLLYSIWRDVNRNAASFFYKWLLTHIACGPCTHETKRSTLPRHSWGCNSRVFSAPYPLPRNRDFLIRFLISRSLPPFVAS